MIIKLVAISAKCTVPCKKILWLPQIQSICRRQTLRGFNEMICSQTIRKHCGEEEKNTFLKQYFQNKKRFPFPYCLLKSICYICYGSIKGYRVTYLDRLGVVNQTFYQMAKLYRWPKCNHLQSEIYPKEKETQGKIIWNNF